MSGFERDYNLETIKDINDAISESDLAEGARIYERFYIRPKTQDGTIIPVRLRINKKLGGWKLKEELVLSLGLTPGDTINTEVSVQLSKGIVEDDGDMDLFADGEAAEWLFEKCEEKGASKGLVIDCVVQLSYSEAPVGENGKMVWKASLILLKGMGCLGIERIHSLDGSDIGVMNMLSLIKNYSGQ